MGLATLPSIAANREFIETAYQEIALNLKDQETIHISGVPSLGAFFLFLFKPSDAKVAAKLVYRTSCLTSCSIGSFLYGLVSSQ